LIREDSSGESVKLMQRRANDMARVATSLGEGRLQVGRQKLLIDIFAPVDRAV
jgi:hypothetical protein